MHSWFIYLNQLVATLVALLSWLLLHGNLPGLGDLIRRIRLAHGWTQEAFAEQLGVDPRSVQRWEREGVIPRPARLAAISALDMRTLLILDGFDELEPLGHIIQGFGRLGRHTTVIGRGGTE